MWLNRHGRSKIIGRVTAFLIAMTSAGLYSSPLTAGEMVKLELTEKQGTFHLVLDMILDAPFEDVHYVITDYAHLYRIDPSIVESEVLGTPEQSVTRVKTRVSDCVLSFCRDILRVEDVRETDDEDIDSVVVPRLSNVQSGTAHWKIQPFGDKTRINYDMTLDPGFSLPPLIGPLILESKLKEETLTCLNNIEHIARIDAEQLKARNSTRNKAMSTRRTTSENEKAN
jgi:hypothetical protein